MNTKPFEELHNEKETAELLYTTPGCMKQSRHTGLLYGMPAPSFIKMGRKVMYKKSEIIKFRNQFPEFSNTAEAYLYYEQG